MKIDGACHCGALAFEAEVDPASASLCHCSDCQILSGSAYRANIPARAEDFRITRGEPKIYVKTADSGARRAMGFCATCGSQIYSTDADNSAIYSLRTGTIRQRAELRPAKQIWTRSALPWSANIEALPASERG